MNVTSRGAVRGRRWPTVVALLCAFAMSACSPDPAVPDTFEAPSGGGVEECSPERELTRGTSMQTVDSGGEERSYLVHVPEGYDGSESTPVVYAFHGLGGTADTFVAYTGWAAKADEEGFIVIAPQGRGPTPGWNFVESSDVEGSDMAFVQDLVAQVDNELCTDSARQFATGFSNGSALVFAFACSGDFDFAAYGAVAAAFYRPQCEPAPSASIIYFHGTADEVVPYDGGPTPIAEADPVQVSMRGWASHNECAQDPDVEDVTSEVQAYAWRSCASGGALEAYYVDGGGHTWPGTGPLTAIEELGVTTDDISATEIIWKFFEAHPEGEQ